MAIAVMKRNNTTTAISNPDLRCLLNGLKPMVVLAVPPSIVPAPKYDLGFRPSVCS